MSPLSAGEVTATAGWLASQQLGNGMVPWYAGGHADPWNHMEAAMAMAAGDRWAEVERAFGWLAANQLPDGSWCTFYLPDGVVEPRRDPNVCAYVATGAWWCALLPGGPGESMLEELWPMVDKALSWCLEQQRPGGEMAWSVGPDGVQGSFALLAACSSVQQSLRNASLVAQRLGHDRPQWAVAADRVAAAVRAGLRRPGAVAGQPSPAPGTPAGPALGRSVFALKDRWSMDWYYPVLTGAVGGQDAAARMASRWDEFVEDGLGTRCVADRFWVTAAETAECAMAAQRAGMEAQARALLEWTRHLRRPDGSYWTGCAHPDCVRFPGGQASTYSAAAVVIADHVVYARSPSASVFAGHSHGTRDGGPGRAPAAVVP